MADISLTQPTCKTVGLFGVEFKARPRTKSVQAKVTDLRKKIADAATEQRQVDLCCQMIACQLDRPEDAEKLLLEKWKAEELSEEQVAWLLEDLEDAVTRPTGS